jgi:Ser/Thr protein kinase RdoA (MazF antagonist)
MPDPIEQPIPAGDLDQIAAAYRLGDIRDTAYLPTGLMNRNWRITTGSGHLALKQIIDVPLPTARRNLRALTALADHGIPACPPLQSVDGDPVIAVDDRGYCLLPWIHGTHPTGEDLTLDQARELGTTLGRIHQALQRNEPATGLPAATTRPAARVIHPATALAPQDPDRQAQLRQAHRRRPAGAFRLDPRRPAAVSLGKSSVGNAAVGSDWALRPPPIVAARVVPWLTTARS